MSDIGRTSRHDRIREHLKLLRESKGMSQRELSKLLGLNSTYCHKLENGSIRRLDIVELENYLAELGTPLTEFLMLIQ